jgi:hypothetical protein
MRFHPPSRTLIAACLLPFGLAGQRAVLPAKAAPHLFFRVVLGTNFTKPQSGRLLLFLAKGAAKSVDTNPFAPQDVSVAAKEVYDLAPGGAVEIDTDDIAFPAGFSHLAPGGYSAQAVLDLRHDYNYLGRAPGDPISGVASLTHFAPGVMVEPVLTLNSTVPESAPPVQDDARARNAIHAEDFVSPALSRFWGRPVHMRSWVVEPPGLQGTSRRPLSRCLLYARLRRKSGTDPAGCRRCLPAHGGKENARYSVDLARRVTANRYA